LTPAKDDGSGIAMGCEGCAILKAPAAVRGALGSQAILYFFNQRGFEGHITEALHKGSHKPSYAIGWG